MFLRKNTVFRYFLNLCFFYSRILQKWYFSGNEPLHVPGSWRGCFAVILRWFGRSPGPRTLICSPIWRAWLLRTWNVLQNTLKKVFCSILQNFAKRWQISPITLLLNQRLYGCIWVDVYCKILQSSANYCKPLQSTFFKVFCSIFQVLSNMTH